MTCVRSSDRGVLGICGDLKLFATWAFCFHIDSGSRSVSVQLGLLFDIPSAARKLT